MVATIKEVGVREFSINTHKYLGGIPLVITKRGKPYLKLEEVSDVATKDNVATGEVATRTKVATDVATKEEKFEELRGRFGVKGSLGRCQAPRCSEGAVGEVLIATPEGEDKERRLCRRHLGIAKKEQGY